ncbi:hypothetical protein [Prevotella falsenii]|uniref:hypothetical protein n=1 Tax=Prevotella falsenii TaxID=515414 RepID=UPI0012EB5DFD|nr:hypothetical protein [Prevotella falsenii]
MLLPLCFLAGFVRLPASAPPFHLAVARYAFNEMPAHLLDNQAKPVKHSNDRFGLIQTSAIYKKERMPLLHSLLSYIPVVL